jgi:transposase
MAPQLRNQPFRTPSPEPLASREATTTKKCKFFDALARSGGTKSLRRISADCKIAESTGRKWKKQWANMGSLAKRRTRPRSSILGHKSKVTKSMYKMLVSPLRNPVRKQPYKAQIEYHNLPVKKRQLQKMMKRNTNGGGRYVCAFVKKEISQKNKVERVTYSSEHNYDEAHVDPTSQTQGRVTRERGTRNNPENIEERPPLKGIRFHIAAWIS